MSADAPPPHASALLLDQPKTSAATLLDALNSGGFRTSAPASVSLPSNTLAKPATPADNTQLLTGKQKPVNEPKNAQSVTRKQTALPKAKGTPPPKVKGYVWRADGSGWEARRLWTDHNGKRKQTYVAHLSREAFGKLRRKHRTPESLATALAEWIGEREREKGIG